MALHAPTPPEMPPAADEGTGEALHSDMSARLSDADSAIHDAKENPSLVAPPLQEPTAVLKPPVQEATTVLKPPVAIGTSPALASEPAAVLAEAPPEPPLTWRARLRRLVVSPFMVSAITHACLLLALALIVVGKEELAGLPGLFVSVRPGEAEPTQLAPIDLQAQVTLRAESLDQFTKQRQEDAPRVAAPSKASGTPNAAPSQTAVSLGSGLLAGGKLLAPIGTGGGGWQGRNGKSRLMLVEGRGGNGASELAVERGLRWIVAHQMNDGSWNFDHQQSPHCGDQCRNPGKIPTKTGATALALLPLLGAGHTHLEGEHSEAVRRGIYYLGNKMLLGKDGGDLRDGTMYAQGLSAIVLCETYGMTHDENLREYAQASLDFIAHAQHSEGGWRYLPGQPGDTTVFGWQLMALKSGQLAGLDVSRSTLYRAAAFLDRVQSDEGAAYGYLSSGDDVTMTSIGLLSRMYLGWQKSNPALARGVARLAKEGPSQSNLYYDYYATQLMNHWEGPEWQSWNALMRDHLIRNQATEGHESGSWYFEDKSTHDAGRLYNTAIAVMILEVYYRHLPLYTRPAVESGDFVVD